MEQKKILVVAGTQKILARIFNCTPASVSLALAGKTDSFMAKQIRKTAIEQYGGVEYPYPKKN